MPTVGSAATAAPWASTGAAGVQAAEPPELEVVDDDVVDEVEGAAAGVLPEESDELLVEDEPAGTVEEEPERLSVR